MLCIIDGIKLEKLFQQFIGLLVTNGAIGKISPMVLWMSAINVKWMSAVGSSLAVIEVLLHVAISSTLSSLGP